MKIVNLSKTKGPYPGRTWEEEAVEAERERGASLFSFLIVAKVEEEKCDHCLGSCSPDFSCCSKKCFEERNQEAREEAEWEARVS
jgi:hypothetical protein